MYNNKTAIANKATAEITSRPPPFGNKWSLTKNSLN